MLLYSCIARKCGYNARMNKQTNVRTQQDMTLFGAFMWVVWGFFGPLEQFILCAIGYLLVIAILCIFAFYGFFFLLELKESNAMEKFINSNFVHTSVPVKPAKHPHHRTIIKI